MHWVSCLWKFSISLVCSTTVVSPHCTHKPGHTPTIRLSGRSHDSASVVMWAGSKEDAHPSLGRLPVSPSVFDIWTWTRSCFLILAPAWIVYGSCSCPGKSNCIFLPLRYCPVRICQTLGWQATRSWSSVVGRQALERVRPGFIPLLCHFFSESLGKCLNLQSSVSSFVK